MDRVANLEMVVVLKGCLVTGNVEFTHATGDRDHREGANMVSLGAYKIDHGYGNRYVERLEAQL